MVTNVKSVYIKLSSLVCCAGSVIEIVVNGNPTDDVIVRKSFALTRVLRQAM